MKKVQAVFTPLASTPSGTGTTARHRWLVSKLGQQGMSTENIGKQSRNWVVKHVIQKFDPNATFRILIKKLLGNPTLPHLEQDSCAERKTWHVWQHAVHATVRFGCCRKKEQPFRISKKFHKNFWQAKIAGLVCSKRQYLRWIYTATGFASISGSALATFLL